MNIKTYFFITFCTLLASCLQEPKKQITKTTNKIQPVKIKLESSSRTLSIEKDTVKALTKEIKQVETIDLENEKYEMTLNKLEELSLYSPNKFENWALSNNYRFLKVVDSEYFDSVLYQKEGNYITFSFDKNSLPIGYVSYQTKDKNEYINLKKECENSNLVESNKVFGEEINKDNMNITEYRNSKFAVSFSISVKNNKQSYMIWIDRNK